MKTAIYFFLVWPFYRWHQVHSLLPSNLEHVQCAAVIWSDNEEPCWERWS